MKGPKMSFLLHFLVLFSVTAFFAEAAKEAEEGSYSANYDPQWARINTPSKRAVAFLNKLILAAKGGGSGHPPRHPQPADRGMERSRPSELSELSLEGADDADYWRDDDPPKEPKDGVHVAEIVALPRSGFERRGQQAPRVFWRCYFNAVSCF